MKKKLISLFLVGAMTAGMVAGCGNSGSTNNAAGENTDNAASSEETSSITTELEQTVSRSNSKVQSLSDNAKALVNNMKMFKF